MNKVLPLFLLVFLLTSCATLFNKPLVRFDVYTKSPATIVVNDDTVPTVKNRSSFMVHRQKGPMLLTSITDSITKTYSIKSLYSLTYLSNIFLTYGIPGYIIDYYSPKRYAFPENIYINPNDSSVKYKKTGNYNHKGELYLNFSVPEVNFIRQFTNYAGIRNNGGFMGLSTGIDYYYKPSQFANLSYSMVATFLVPFPAPVDYFGPYESAWTSYVSLSNNHRFGILSLGYGLSFSKNVWNYYNYNDNWVRSAYYTVHKQSYALGLVFPVYCKLGRTFNLGLLYRPSFYRPYSPQPFKYEHLISVDLAWKFLIKR